MNAPYFCIDSLQAALALNERVPDDEAGRRMKAWFRAVLKDEHGVDEMADFTLSKADEYYEQRRRARAKRGLSADAPVAKKVTPVEQPRTPVNKTRTPVEQPRTPAGTINETNETKEGNVLNEIETETETEMETEQCGPVLVSGSGSGSGSTSSKKTPSFSGVTGQEQLRREDGGVAAFMMKPLDGLDLVEGWALPGAMAEYCHDHGNKQAVNAFKKAVRQDEATTREKFRQFVAECEAGQEPNNRGAALTARLDYAGLVEGVTSRKKSGDVTIRGVRVAANGHAASDDIDF